MKGIVNPLSLSFSLLSINGIYDRGFLTLLAPHCQEFSSHLYRKNLSTLPIFPSRRDCKSAECYFDKRENGKRKEKKKRKEGKALRISTSAFRARARMSGGEYFLAIVVSK